MALQPKTTTPTNQQNKHTPGGFTQTSNLKLKPSFRQLWELKNNLAALNLALVGIKAVLPYGLGGAEAPPIFTNFHACASRLAAQNRTRVHMKGREIVYDRTLII